MYIYIYLYSVVISWTLDRCCEDLTCLCRHLAPVRFYGSGLVVVVCSAMKSTVGAVSLMMKMNDTIAKMDVKTNLEFAMMCENDNSDDMTHTKILKTPESRRRNHHDVTSSPSSTIKTKTKTNNSKSGKSKTETLPTLVELASMQLKPKPTVQYRGGRPVTISDRALIHGWW